MSHQNFISVFISNLYLKHGIPIRNMTSHLLLLIIYDFFGVFPYNETNSFFLINEILETHIVLMNKHQIRLSDKAHSNA